MTHLLDTTVLVDFIRGREATVARLLGLPGVSMISAITLDELERGWRPTDPISIDDALTALVVVPVGEAEARVSGAWRREFAARGVTLSPADSLIAACAVSRGAVLATANVKDFPMPELSVEAWPSK